MDRARVGSVMPSLRHLFEGRSTAGVPERQLLRRYHEGRDEVAFEALVSRHGPMVLGVCRRILPDPRDVEDAFQATFVILAEKGRTLGEDDPVARWLYGVACRVALRARSSAARRRRLEGSAAPSRLTESDDPARQELASVIDRELAALPDRYRAPVVLCYLEGLTHDEASRRLGWPLGTVKGRLARARDLLKGRLARQGFAPSGMIALARSARVAIPKSLLEMTMRAAMASRSGGVVPPAVACLAAGSLSTMILNKLKALGVAAVMLSTGAAVMAYQFGGMGTVGGVQGKPAPNAPARVMPAPASTTPADDVSDWPAGWPDLTNPPDTDPKTKAILAVLEKPISMNFPTDTPLEDVKKYIQEATKESPGLAGGIPIYVDPQGLQDSDKTMASTVVIQLEGIPLKTTLRLLLKQLSLEYVVRDGLLTITSTSADDQPTPFNIMQVKARRGELTREQYRQLIEALKMKKQIDSLMAPPPQATGGGFQ
jgi:RNA polymerase sigma factor (sigma-70 family)